MHGSAYTPTYYLEHDVVLVCICMRACLGARAGLCYTLTHHAKHGVMLVLDYVHVARVKGMRACTMLV